MGSSVLPLLSPTSTTPPRFTQSGVRCWFGVEGWLASTYQCNSEPRDYQECSQVHEPRVRGCRFLGVAYQRQVAYFSRDFQSADHTAFFGTPEPETSFETPNPILSLVSPRTSVFIHSFREWSSAYLSFTG
ncbi:hypothetical protein AVEN_216419-1 [Araneus ventricosus]|uniref:Uncharacterized protein n=1 Tax=Araneus ventricosus TaxID=182803 RepID=A0A4Y2H2I8_ARAVE|nr:hypothetical protein AVEN_216419-1 [Araneus ventricosus]